MRAGYDTARRDDRDSDREIERREKRLGATGFPGSFSSSLAVQLQRRQVEFNYDTLCMRLQQMGAFGWGASSWMMLRMKTLQLTLVVRVQV